MKIKKINLEEEYSNNDFMNHLKHMYEYENDPIYSSLIKQLKDDLTKLKLLWDTTSNVLAKSKAGKSDSDDIIVGYVQKDGRFVKYNKNTNDFLVYTIHGNYIKTRTLHKKTLDEYNKIKNRDFFNELPENRDEKQ